MNELMSNNNEVYDLDKIMNIVGLTSMNVKNLSDQMGVVTTAVKDLKDDVSNIAMRMDNIEQNEEITTTQEANIVTAAKRRVCEIVGSTPEEYNKYYRIFIQNLYKDARRYASLGSSISRTRKRDYQRCIDYIDAWDPIGGCAKLKRKADENAKARLKAKSLGYL